MPDPRSHVHLIQCDRHFYLSLFQEFWTAYTQPVGEGSGHNYYQPFQTSIMPENVPQRPDPRVNCMVIYSQIPAHLLTRSSYKGAHSVLILLCKSVRFSH